MSRALQSFCVGQLWSNRSVHRAWVNNEKSIAATELPSDLPSHTTIVIARDQLRQAIFREHHQLRRKAAAQHDGACLSRLSTQQRSYTIRHIRQHVRARWDEPKGCGRASSGASVHKTERKPACRSFKGEYIPVVFHYVIVGRFAAAIASCSTRTLAPGGAARRAAAAHLRCDVPTRNPSVLR
jgi:hypothetical protein